MTKAELIEAIQAATSKHELSKGAVADVVDAAFEAIIKAIKDKGRMQVPGFGTFSLKERAARQGRNPKTRETITIPASKSVGFKPAPGVKDKL